MSSTDIVTTMLRHSDEGDFDAFRALLDPKCKWVNPMINAEGADEISANLASFSSAFPQRRHDVSLTIESGGTVAVEGEWVAEHESGALVRTPFAAMIRVRDERVAAVRVYVDTAAFGAQLGATAAA
jgi:ketosteroid isomerase-like protein